MLVDGMAATFSLYMRILPGTCSNFHYCNSLPLCVLVNSWGVTMLSR